MSTFNALKIGFLFCLLPVYAGATDLHVAIDGSDTNSGTAAFPFRTIAKASTVATPGDTVVIHEGTYREQLRPSASGTSINPVIYRAERSARNVDSVTVSSFDIITPGTGGNGSWQVESGSIYRIQLNAGLPLPLGQNMIAVNGEPLREARWPNAPRVVDFRRAHMARADSGDVDPGSDDGTGTYTGWYDDSDLNSFANDAWTGGTIQLTPEQGWWQKTGIVTDFSGQRVTFRWIVTDLSRETPSKMDPYYLSGRLVALDEPGEFFLDVNGLDGPANTLYIWMPDSSSPTTSNIEIKTRLHAADLSSRANIQLVDLTILGGRIYGDNSSSNLLVERCTVSYGAYDSNLSDPYDGSVRAAIHLDGDGHIVRDSNVYNTMTNGINARDGSQEVSNCVVFNAWRSGINTITTGSGLVITDNTVFDTGSAVIDITAKASRFLRNHVFRGSQHITDMNIMNTYNSGDALGTEVAWNWVHDNRAEEEPLYRWNGGGGIRLDGGGSADGCSNYIIHHNVIWDAGSRGIGVWGLDPGMVNYGTVDGAKVFVYNNTSDSSIGIRAGQDTTGIHLGNNLALDDMYFGNANHEAGATLSTNRKAILSDFTGAIGNVFKLASGSPAIDSGTVFPGITDGYLGGGPDIGAHENGLDFPVPGARILAEDMDGLQYAHQILNDGSSIIEVSGLPLGRTVPDGMTLRLGGSLVLADFYRTWDFASGYFGAQFPFDYTSVGFTDIGIEHSMNGSSYTTASQGTLTIQASAIDYVSTQKLSAGDILVISGTNLYGHDHYRIPIELTHSIANDLYLRPVPLRFDSASLIDSGILKADGRDLWFPVDETGERLQYALEGGWNTPYTVVWLRLPPDTHTFREENGLTFYLAGGGMNTPIGDKIDLPDMFSYMDFSKVALWFRPDSISVSLVDGVPVGQWEDVSGLSRHAAQTDTTRQPLLALSPDRPPTVSFDGANDYLAVGDLPYGNYDFWTIYRSPDPGPTTHQRILSATPRNHPDPGKNVDYLGGLAGLPEREPDGTSVVYTDLHMESLSRSDRYPDDFILGGQSAPNPAYNMLKAELAEIFLFAENLPDSVSERIESDYLAMKYGMSLWNGYFATLDIASMTTPNILTVGGVIVDSFTHAGSDTVTLEVPDFGQSASVLSLTIELPDGSIEPSPVPLYYYTLPYDGWRIDQFGSLPGGPLGPGTGRDDDADNDRRSNFLEFAYADNPLSAATGTKWPELVKISDQLHYRMTTGRPSTEVQYTYQFSHDMTNWALPAPISLPAETPAGEEVSVQLTPAEGLPVFVRVEVVEIQ